jgi:hypothetical protein
MIEDMIEIMAALGETLRENQFLTWYFDEYLSEWEKVVSEKFREGVEVDIQMNINGKKWFVG